MELTRRTRTAAAALFALFAALAGADGPAAPPAIPEIDRIRLAEACHLAGRIGDRIWPGWSGTPFAVVLVTPETEFFVRHPHPPADAKRLGRDALLDSEVFARPRTFPTGFLAALPLEGVSTVVFTLEPELSAPPKADCGKAGGARG
ncbi:MAG TPA: hypothetical protein VMN82_10825 [Thermoanaerobaculia bacterium]|nr:hypothetical protein [Thermoanaerobaculia bacterium]